MGREDSTAKLQATRRASKSKSLRTVRLAVLFQMSWPKRLTREEIIKSLTLYYGENPVPALYRDLATLTGWQVEKLPQPGDEGLFEWCLEQSQRGMLAITYDRSAGTFGLEQTLFQVDISEIEARAFVALQEGFSKGTPYAEAVQQLLKRWEWLFTEKSSRLVDQKRRRRSRPLHLPLSPVVDYSQHGETILELDEALQEGVYVSFTYISQERSWRNQEPMRHEHLEPYELEYRDGHWYFTAFASDVNTFLDFRVDHIQPGTVYKHKEHFLPGQRHRSGVKIRYWVSPMLARHGSLSARLREQQVTLLDDNQGALVEGYAKSIWWAKKLLLGYGEQVKALEPEELVIELRKSARTMNRLYEEEK